MMDDVAENSQQQCSINTNQETDGIDEQMEQSQMDAPPPPPPMMMMVQHADGQFPPQLFYDHQYGQQRSPPYMIMNPPNTPIMTNLPMTPIIILTPISPPTNPFAPPPTPYMPMTPFPSPSPISSSTTSMSPAPYSPGEFVYHQGGPPPHYYPADQQHYYDYHGSSNVASPSPSMAVASGDQQFEYEEQQPNNVFQFDPPATSTPVLIPITPMQPIQGQPTPPFIVAGYLHTTFNYPSPNDSVMMAARTGEYEGSPMYYYPEQPTMPMMGYGDQYYESDQGGRQYWNHGPGMAKRGNNYYECGFCKRNGESQDYYSSHRLRHPDGRVECPILRAFTCPYCRATGDGAHTASYCPNQPPNGAESFGRVRLNRTAAGRIRNYKQ